MEKVKARVLSLDEHHLEKSKPHKYIKRLGAPGKYQYVYRFENRHGMTPAERGELDAKSDWYKKFENKTFKMDEKGEVDPFLIRKKEQLERKASKIDAAITHSEMGDMPGTYITGGSGVPASRIRTIDRQLGRRIERAKEAIETGKELGRIEAKIDYQENAPKRERIESQVADYSRKQFDSIEVGDKIDVGGNDLATVIKKNPKSVVTTSGAKWTDKEIYKVIKDNKTFKMQPSKHIIREEQNVPVLPMNRQAKMYQAPTKFVIQQPVRSEAWSRANKIFKLEGEPRHIILEGGPNRRLTVPEKAAKFKKELETSYPTHLKPEVKKNMNNMIYDIIKNTYYDDIPLGQIFEVARAHGVVPLQEDNTEWSGFLLLDGDGQMTLPLAPEGSRRGAVGGATNFLTPFKNATLHLSWHKMESGRYEVLSHVS